MEKNKLDKIDILYGHKCNPNFYPEFNYRSKKVNIFVKLYRKIDFDEIWWNIKMFLILVGLLSLVVAEIKYCETHYCVPSNYVYIPHPSLYTAAYRR